VSPEQTLTLGVKEQFEFSSALQRMSVLCTDLSTDDNWAYVKGSPEMMETLCVPESIPSNYRTILSYFAHQGYRVIAIGQKRMDDIPRIDKSVLRGIVERGLTFLGLILLENKLKVSRRGVARDQHSGHTSNSRLSKPDILAFLCSLAVGVAFMRFSSVCDRSLRLSPHPGSSMKQRFGVS
jgi:hypothetical protein